MIFRKINEGHLLYRLLTSSQMKKSIPTCVSIVAKMFDTNSEFVDLGFDIVIRSTEESHRLPGGCFVILRHVKQRALRHEEHDAGEHERSDTAKDRYHDDVPCVAATVSVQNPDHEQ